MAFEQVNKERSHIINKQGEIMADFAERIRRFDPNVKDVSKSGIVELTDLLRRFNKGGLFSEISPDKSFK